MNPIFQFIQMLILLIVGTKTVQPVNDLHKKPTKEDHLKTINCFILRYWGICAGLFLLAIFIVFVIFCYSYAGTGIESGHYYYHLKEVI